MTIIIENAGAQRGVLILRRDQQLLVQAEGRIATDVTQVEATPLAAYPRLPQNLVNYVARVREPLVLGDAAQEGNFTNDPYIKEHQPRSVLCQPLVNQGQLAGLLYLENNLASGAFTPARLRLLNLLSSQAAIAIEKAQLYSTLQASERKYRTLYADSRDSIFIATLDDRIIDINPAGVELLGYSAEDLIPSTSVADLYVQPEDRARFIAAISTGGSVKDFEAQLRTGDGRVLDCLLTATLRYDEDGNNIGYQGIIRDITAQKRAEQERLRLSAIERELSVATALQQSMLPPGQPDWPELPLFSASIPAREVGGDFYSYRRLSAPGEPGRYALAVGDLTGKGIGAALLMATALSQFDASLALNLSPAERMAHLDGAIMPYTRPRRQNCGLCYVEIEHHPDGSSRIEAINAGGIPPYLKRADGAVEFVEIGGFALGQGIGQRMGYRGRVLEGRPGDLIILTSDGVVEANDAAETMFGFERLVAALEAGPVGDAAAMLAHLQDTLTAFVGTTEPHDDMTIMVVRL
jgi:PAS domain S-box-containing protein